MKKADSNFRGCRGSIPPQLFKYIDTNHMAAETVRFTEYINGIARNFVCDPRKEHIIAPELFGYDMTLKYSGGGLNGDVFRMDIGENAFALKINRNPDKVDDLIVMSECTRARNLINRHYIGATFDGKDGQIYSWILSDWVENNSRESYIRAKEKLFYALMTKRLCYYDYCRANIRNGLIVDIDGIERIQLDLNRTEIDMVKKMMYLIRTNNLDAFEKLGQVLLTRFPKVIGYLGVHICCLAAELPEKFAPFIKVINTLDYSLIARTELYKYLSQHTK